MRHLYKSFIQLLIENKFSVNLNTKISATFLCCENFVFVTKKIQNKNYCARKTLIWFCLYSKLVCSSLHIHLFFVKFPLLFHDSYLSVHHRQYLSHLRIDLIFSVVFILDEKSFTYKKNEWS